jgi:integrase
MKHLSKPELDALLAVAKESSPHDHLLFLLAFNHGLRISEVINLTANNFRDGYITVQRLKGSMKTSQKLLPNEAALLAEYKIPECGRLFPIDRTTAWRRIKRLGAAAGIPEHKCFCHALKHTTAKLAIKAGMGLPELKQYLGHRSLSSTGAYLVSDDEEASNAFAKAMGGL